MATKEQAVKEYSEKNFLIVYGHQDQIEHAFESGWEKGYRAAMEHLHGLTVSKAVQEVVEYNIEAK